MTKNAMEALNQRRLIARYFPLGIAALELIAVLMMMTGVRVLGLALGLAVLIGGIFLKSRIKKMYTETCCRAQTMTALGLSQAEYVGEHKPDVEWLHQTHLMPISAQLSQPLVMHAVRGKLRNTELWMGEVNFGCHENGKKAPTYSSGVLVHVSLSKFSQENALLLGEYAFKHAALRAEYEKDGMRLSPAGGKEKGWYALTPGAVSPSDVLCEKWEAVCAAAKQRAALYVGGNKLVAFFNGQFFTSEFSLEEELTESMLRKHSFAAIVPLMDLIEAMKG